MQGSSRGSLAAAVDRLEPLLAADDDRGGVRAVIDKVTGRGASANETSQLGEELFSVAALLDSSVGLRRALTDPSRDAEAKAGLVGRLLDDHVSGTTVDVVAGMARDRWSRARDLADACEHLGASAVLASAQREDALDTVEDEVFRFGRIVDGSAELRAALADRKRSGTDKAQLVEDLLAGKVRPQTLVLARQAVLAPRGRRLLEVLEGFGRAAAQRRDRMVARVTAAVPLTEDQRERLTQVLARVYERTMHLDVDVDPDLLGGLRVQVGDEVIDASVLTRLDEARRRLAG
jgi:F-type H+-transporting ATPase subunit delta